MFLDVFSLWEVDRFQSVRFGKAAKKWPGPDKALVAGPLKKITFFAVSLRRRLKPSTLNEELTVHRSEAIEE